MQLNVLVSWQTSKGGRNASLLYEVPKKGGDQEPEVHYNEEWSAGDSGQLPNL
jgi:hypothetical protein